MSKTLVFAELCTSFSLAIIPLYINWIEILMTNTIVFTDFKINTSTRETYRNNKKIDLQYKSYDLLIYLIENKDRAVSKDELINEVWDGRVVTDSALTHAVYRLRTALRDTKGKELIIRTVRGYGLQFIAEIKPQTVEIENQQQSTNKKTTNFKRLSLLGLVLLISFSIYFAVNQNSQTPDSGLIVKAGTQEPIQHEAGVSVGFSSNVKNNETDAWLSQGMILYLNQLLAFSNNSTPDLLFMIGSNTNNIIDVELNSNSILLSYNQDTDQKLELQLDNIPLTIASINQWVCNTVIINDRSNCENNILKLTSNSSFIIENYIRGITAIINDENDKAINFLTICLQQDGNFLFARLALSKAYFKRSDYKKSISQLQTLILMTQNTRLVQQAYILLGKNYFRLSKYKEAQENLLMVVENNENNDSIKAVAMMELALVFKETSSNKTALMYAQESSDILVKTKLKNHSARASKIMGSINLSIGDLESAEKHLTQALNIFESTGNLSGLEATLSSLGLVSQYQGKSNASLAFANRRQKIVEQQGDPIEIAGSHLQLAYLLLEMGDLETATKHANNMWEIVTNEDEPRAIMLANVILAEVASAKMLYDLAFIHYQSALKIARDLGLPKRETTFLCNIGKVASDNEIYNKADEFLTQCKELSDEIDYTLFKAVSRLYLGGLYRQQNQSTKSEIKLNEALAIAKEVKMDKLIYDISLEFFNLYLQDDIKKAELNLQKTPEAFRDDFLYVFAQAQLEKAKTNYPKALQLILLAKQKAGDNWTTSDQNLLHDIKLQLAD